MGSDGSWQLSARTSTSVQALSVHSAAVAAAGATNDRSVRSWSQPVCKAGFSGRGGSRGPRGWGSASTGGTPWFYRVGRYGLGAGSGGLFWFSAGRYHAYAEPLFPLVQPVKKKPKKGGKRVLILMSDTGGGHRASAQAIKAAFEQLYGSKYEVNIVDLWVDYTAWPLNQAPKSYGTLVRHPFLWWLSYQLTQPRLIHRACERLTAWQAAPGVNRAFAEYDPDLVVSVHPLMQGTPLRVLRRRVAAGQMRPVNFATVVTDLTTCHNTWFNPGVTKCFVATQEAKQLALDMGLTEQQVVMHGLPIRPEFSRGYGPKRKVRRRLGLAEDMPTVLLIGGGEGMGPVEKTVLALAKARVPCQVVVVCGRNKKLQAKLAAREYPNCTRVVPLGFVDNMPEWMGACDAVITKAGPGTISEALICGLPLLLNANVPCQEEGNIPFVVGNRVGACERDPTRAAAVIRRWFEGAQGELGEMKTRAKALGRPDAVFRIVRDLRDLAEQRPPLASLAPLPAGTVA